MARYYVVTDYALSQLRELLRKLGKRNLLAKSNEALKDMIDNAAFQAVMSRQTRSFDNRDGKGVMADVSDWMGVSLWAFLRPDREKDGTLSGRTALVTVMTHTFVAALEAKGGLGRVSVQEAKELAETPDEDLEPRLISYKNRNDKPCTAECIAKDLKDVMHQLLYEGAIPGSIRSWRPVKAKARFVVDVDE